MTSAAPPTPAVDAGAMGWTRARALSTAVPATLLAAGLIFLVVFVVQHAGDYGRTFDEAIQNYYGQLIYQWYASGGADDSFLDLPPESHITHYGPAFELLVAWFQQRTGDPWHTRAVVGGLVGVLGIGGIALVGRQLAGWWGALLAATALALYPRYFGAMANNSKDVPLTVVMIFVLWATIRLVRRWSLPGTPGQRTRRRAGDAALLGMLIGIGASVRSIAVVWVLVLALLVAGRWLLPARRPAAGLARAEVRDQVVAALVCGAVSYAVILALFPYVFLHPVTGFVESVLLLSRYDWPGSVLFDGEMVPGKDVPWNYAPQWLLIGSPPVTVALAVVGLGLLVADRVRRRAADPAVLLAAGLFVVPLLLIIVRGATLYNALRQFLFVVPGMILIGVVALVRLWRAANTLRAGPLGDVGEHRTVDGAPAHDRRVVPAWLALIALVGVVLAGHVEALAATVRLYPLEYVYFSPIVGGFAGAHDRYEKDYWRACETVSLHWIDEHRAELGIGERASVFGVWNGGYYPMPPGLRPAAQDERPDIVISNEFTPPRPDYPVVHEILAEGVPVCTIQLAPAR